MNLFAACKQNTAEIFMIQLCHTYQSSVEIQLKKDNNKNDKEGKLVLACCYPSTQLDSTWHGSRRDADQEKAEEDEVDV